MDLKLWDMWPEELHSDPDQLKRQSSARKSDMTPIEVNDDYAVFKGSKGNYRTTLSSCDCGDFRRRRVPCKHMYRLAFEVGLFNLGAADVDENIGRELRINDAMKIVEQLPEDLQIRFRDMLYDIYYGKGQALISQDDFEVLHNAYLVNGQTDKRAILESFKRADLIPLIPEGVPCKKSKISTIVDCILENSDPDCIEICSPNRMAVLDGSVSKLALAMYRRLLQKYPREEEW